MPRYHFKIVKGISMWRIDQYANSSIIGVRYCRNWIECVVVLEAWGVW